MYAGGVTERSKILRRHPQGRYGTPPWRLEPHSGGSILVITGGSLLASAEGEIANDRLPPSESEINKPLLRFGKQEQRFLVIRRSRVSGMR